MSWLRVFGEVRTSIHHTGGGPVWSYLELIHCVLEYKEHIELLSMMSSRVGEYGILEFVYGPAGLALVH